MLSSKTSFNTKLCANKAQGVSFLISVFKENCTLYNGEYRNVLGDTVIIVKTEAIRKNSG